MSALTGALDADVDLDDGVATVDLFDGDVCRLGEDGDDWWGIVRDSGAFYWYDSTNDKLPEKFRIGQQAVRDLIRSALAGDTIVRPELPGVAP